MIYQYQRIEPRWISFENTSGAKGAGGTENNGAKGHPFESLKANEEKTLCNFNGCGIIRRIWLTINDRSPEALQNIYVKMFWDGADTPHVNVPLGDFFLMGLGQMKPLENEFFTTGEGRSFCCTIPMPFRKSARIVLYNASELNLTHLYYDVDLTLEPLDENTMYFCATFQDILQNELEKDLIIFESHTKPGRFLGTNLAIIPDTEKYGNLWWGESEVKIFLDGDSEHATLVGTGLEDYIGSAWCLGEFINRYQGCASKIESAASVYRFHVSDPIFFKKDIKVTLQTIGGGKLESYKKLSENNVPHIPISYDAGEGLRGIYKKDYSADELVGWVNFYRQDHYRIVAYYYLVM